MISKSNFFASDNNDSEVRGNNRRNFLKFAAGAVIGTAATPLFGSQPQNPAVPSPDMFKGSKSQKIQTTGASINVVSGGQGPPVLLLHGNPETHVMWHKVAPRLATEFSVFAADLRGYGDSSKPEGGENHSNYSKRAMALDQIELMSHFGFEKFAVVGHDRGGRVGHRMALDYPDRVTRAHRSGVWHREDALQPFDFGNRLGDVHCLNVQHKHGNAQRSQFSGLHAYQESSNWVRNLRAAGEGAMGRGHSRRPINVVELPPKAAGKLLKEVLGPILHLRYAGTSFDALFPSHPTLLWLTLSLPAATSCSRSSLLTLPSPAL